MLIADAVLPRVPVAPREFSWTRYPPAQKFTVPRTIVGRRGRVERVEFSSKQESSECYNYGLEDGIPIDDINAAATMRSRGLGTFNQIGYRQREPAPRVADAPGFITQAQVNLMWRLWQDGEGDGSDRSLAALARPLGCVGGLATLTEAGAGRLTDGLLAPMLARGLAARETVA